MVLVRRVAGVAEAVIEESRSVAIDAVKFAKVADLM